jgi:hypothetical protein
MSDVYACYYSSDLGYEDCSSNEARWYVLAYPKVQYYFCDYHQKIAFNLWEESGFSEQIIEFGRYYK